MVPGPISDEIPPTRLLMLRNMSRQTRRQLGERVAVGPQQVARWETRREPIPEEYQALIANMFAVSVVFLMGGGPPLPGGGAMTSDGAA